MKVLVVQLCPTLCDPMGCSPPGSTVQGILRARILEWVAISFSRGSPWPREWTPVSCIAGRCFTIWATREVPQSISCIFGCFLRSIHVVRLGSFHCWVVFNCMGIPICLFHFPVIKFELPVLDFYEQNCYQHFCSTFYIDVYFFSLGQTQEYVAGSYGKGTF